MAESNGQLARRGYEAAARGDFGALAGLLDPEVRWHGGDPAAAGACRNRQEALEFMREAHRSGGMGELVEVIEAGEKVVVIMRLMTKDGEQETLSANLTTFRDQKAVEMVHFPRPEDALAAAGIEDRSA